MSVQTAEAPAKSPWKKWLLVTVVAGSLLLCAILPSLVGALGAWGLVPLIVYAVVILLGTDILAATAFAALLAIILAGLNLAAIGTVLTQSLGSFIATIGLIIMLGAGLGAVARETGAADALVRGLVRSIGMGTRARVQLGIMIASTVLVGALGTLAGANAIIAPIIIPVAARVRWSRPAVAAMIHSAGAAGLMLGPFTPPVVTIMGVSQLTYLQYLYAAGLPMALTTWLVGFGMARWIQRRTVDSDAYDEAEAGDGATEPDETMRHGRAAAWGFALSIVVMTVLGVILKAGYSYAILVMAVSAVVTAALGRLPVDKAFKIFVDGAASLVWLFFLFWLFNPLLDLTEKSGAYTVIFQAVSPTLQTAGPWVFLFLSLLIGWLAVPGAAVAQVTLIHKLLWPIAAGLGIPHTAWAASLLGGSQIDWFGPLPNGDMVGQMGLARSSNLRMMLYNGWAVMAANLVVLSIMFVVL